jgi:hypothetical protein
MHTTLSNIGTVPITMSVAFTSASTLLGVSGHTLLEQTVSTDSCPLRAFDFCGN